MLVKGEICNPYGKEDSPYYTNNTKRLVLTYIKIKVEGI